MAPTQTTNGLVFVLLQTLSATNNNHLIFQTGSDTSKAMMSCAMMSIADITLSQQCCHLVHTLAIRPLTNQLTTSCAPLLYIPNHDLCHKVPKWKLPLLRGGQINFLLYQHVVGGLLGRVRLHWYSARKSGNSLSQTMDPRYIHVLF